MQVLISLTEKRREKEYEKTETECRKPPSVHRLVYALYLVFQPQRHPCEIYRTYRAEESEYQIKRNVSHCKRSDRTLERRLVAQKYVRNHRCGDCRQQQRQDGRHRDIEQEYFQCEKHTGKRSLENTRNSTCRATSEQDRHVLIRQSHIPCDIRTDRSSCIHDRSLCSDRTSETDSHRRSEH